MKMLLTLILFTSSIVQAAPHASDEWVMFCSDRQTFIEYLAQSDMYPTAEELKEADESRQSMLTVLAKGKKGIAEVLEEGNRNGSGGFGVILVCGMIDQIKSEILERGCYSLNAKKPVKDRGGIKACEEILATIPRD